MSDFEIVVGVKLDTANIGSDLKNFKFKPIKIPAELDTSQFKKQANELGKMLSQLEKYSKSPATNALPSTGGIAKEYQQLIKLSKEMGSKNLKINKLDNTANAGQVEQLSKELTGLEKQYQQTLNSLQSKLPTDQFKALSEEIDQINNKFKNGIAEQDATKADSGRVKQLKDIEKQAELTEKAQAKLNETNKALAEKQSQDATKIKEKINTSEIDLDFSKATQSLNNFVQTSDKVENAFNELKQAKLDLENSGSDKQYIDNYKKFTDTLSKAKNEMKMLSISQNEVMKSEVLSQKSSEFQGKIDAYLSKNTAIPPELKEKILSIKNAVGDVNSSADLSNLNRQFRMAKDEATALGVTGKSIGDQLKSTLSSVAGFVGIGSALAFTTSSIKKMVKEVYNVDTAFTDMLKVTDETDVRYDQFLTTAKKKAVDLSRTMSDIITESSEWAKLGYSIDQSEVLSETSSIYANVGEIDSKTAVGDIITAMKAFNIEAENSMEIVDSYNKLGNEFAISSAGIGEGVRNSASSLALAGNDLDQTIAMITGMTEITQNASESGNALKILSMRVRGKHMPPYVETHMLCA